MLSNFIALNLLELKICTKESMSFKYGMSSIVFLCPDYECRLSKEGFGKGGTIENEK